MVIIGSFQVLEVYLEVDSNRRSRKYIKYLCKSCNTEHTTRHSNIKRAGSLGVCKECSYLYRETRPDGHGLSGHRLYTIWDHMVQRTCNQSSDSYVHYGGRGISIDSRWRTDFLSFYTWAMTNGYSDTLSIDRIDVNSDYTPDNCRWATTTVQARNTRVLQKNNTSGYRGVYISGSRCEAYITVNYKKIHLGSYLTVIEAAEAYDNYVLINNLEHNINFPEMEVVC